MRRALWTIVVVLFALRDMPVFGGFTAIVHAIS